MPRTPAHAQPPSLLPPPPKHPRPPGQVTVHLKGKTECYECTNKPAPKTYPICTLRNTPDKPIHCIVWAKDMLFGRLFGAQDAVTGVCH